MSTANPVDTARLNLLLNELRLPAIKVLWPQFAEQSDKEGWPAARFLATIAEHEIAERGPPSRRAPSRRGAAARRKDLRQLRLRGRADDLQSARLRWRLSAGAADAAIMGATYGDLYATIGIHSGLACGSATDLPSALVAMRQGRSDHKVISGDWSPVPTIVFHGDRDTTVHPNNGGQILQRSVGAMNTQRKVHRGQVPGELAYTRTILSDASGQGMLEHWNIHGAGHAWSGGSPAGSYTDPRGPDATSEMLRFFLEHSLPEE